MRAIVMILLSLTMTACNSVYLKPNTLDKDAMIYAPRGGSGMAKSIKQTMEERGYKLNVGRLKHVSEISGTEIYQILKDSKYAVNVKKDNESFRPVWCVFNGFWWWDFNVSIIERANNTEILAWRGRGCANSSLRKLNKYLDKLEIKPDQPEQETSQVDKNTGTEYDDYDYYTEDIVAILSDENSEE